VGGRSRRLNRQVDGVTPDDTVSGSRPISPHHGIAPDYGRAVQATGENRVAPDDGIAPDDGVTPDNRVAPDDRVTPDDRQVTNEVVCAGRGVVLDGGRYGCHAGWDHIIALKRRKDVEITCPHGEDVTLESVGSSIHRDSVLVRSQS